MGVNFFRKIGHKGGVRGLRVCSHKNYLSSFLNISLILVFLQVNLLPNHPLMQLGRQFSSGKSSILVWRSCRKKRNVILGNWRTPLQHSIKNHASFFFSKLLLFHFCCIPSFATYQALLVGSTTLPWKSSIPV